MAPPHRENKFDDGFYVDIAFLLIKIITIIGLGILYLVFLNDPTLPGGPRSCLKLITFIIIGTAFEFLACMAHHGKIIFKTTWSEMSLFQFGLTFGGIIGIQLLIQGISVFNVTVGQVYAFYIFAAIAEESLFRAGLCNFLLGITKSIGSDKNSYIIRSIISVLITSVVFMISHEAYYEFPLLLLTTFLSSIVLGASYCISKGNILVCVLSHGFNNAAAASSIVQTLQSIYRYPSTQLFQPYLKIKSLWRRF